MIYYIMNENNEIIRDLFILKVHFQCLSKTIK